jgi:phosphopantothenoylcysteine decarboxylase / phosphopantothenate---cysteine ligase
VPRILLGVCGGIAAYKAVELTRLALKAGHSVRVVQTEAATRFVGPATFAGITGAPVLVSEWEPDPLRGAFPGDPAPEHAPLSHLALVERADVFAIAPASAQTLAKLAHGHADNLLTAAALACRRPLIVAPAMNNAMYENAATQANLATLRERGVVVLEPGSGPLGSPGEFGIGRLPEPPELLAAIERALARDRSLDGLNVLVTAGGTREPIDAVRFVGNRSSGRMGLALAGEAQRRGARVTVVAANVSIPRPPGLEYVDVNTAAELADACAARFDACDVLLMAAAVADYRPASAHAGKLKKDATGETLKLDLTRTEDVLAGLAARRRPGQLIVGFAAEHGDDALAYGREKLARKGLDAIVVNDVGAAGVGFESPDNEVWIVTAQEERHVPKESKARIAAAILDAVLTRRSQSDIKVRR